MLSLAVLGSVVSLVPQKNATANSGAPVNIASPLPLPVTGNVTAAVSGTVAAQQSGAWSVSVSNPASAPLPTVGTDDPGKHAVTQSCTFIVAITGAFPGSEQGQCQMPNGSADSELVVDSVSARFITIDPSAQPIDIQFLSTVGGSSCSVDIPYPQSPFPGVGAFPFGQSLRSYADPGTAIACTINVLGATLASASSGTCSIAGHVVARH
jgi:hypothetical protein